MRVPIVLLIVASALLLLALTEFSQTAAIPVVLGSGIVLLAYWNSKRLVGLAGFFVAIIGVALTARITDLADGLQILKAGFLLVLPSCLLLWCALAASGSREEDPAKRGATTYIVAAAFGATLLAAVPLAGNVFPSMRFSGDTGVQTSIMLLGFAAAIWSTAILGRLRE
jgi:hypothetical protein